MSFCVFYMKFKLEISTLKCEYLHEIVYRLTFWNRRHKYLRKNTFWNTIHFIISFITSIFVYILKIALVIVINISIKYFLLEKHFTKEKWSEKAFLVHNIILVNSEIIYCPMICKSNIHNRMKKEKENLDWRKHKLLDRSYFHP